MATEADVHGHRVPEGSVLTFAPNRGLRDLVADAPDVEVVLGDEATEGYRDPSGRKRLRIDRSGKLW